MSQKRFCDIYREGVATVFDADNALLPGPVPRHPGDRASEAHPVQEAGGRCGSAEWALQL